MTICAISDALSDLKSIPVEIPEWFILLRSESEKAREFLEKIKIPYPGRVIETVIT